MCKYLLTVSWRCRYTYPGNETNRLSGCSADPFHTLQPVALCLFPSCGQFLCLFWGQVFPNLLDHKTHTHTIHIHKTKSVAPAHAAFICRHSVSLSPAAGGGGGAAGPWGAPGAPRVSEIYLRLWPLGSPEREWRGGGESAGDGTGTPQKQVLLSAAGQCRRPDD